MTNSNPSADFSIVDTPTSPGTDISSPKSTKSLPDLTNIPHQAIPNRSGAPPSLTMSYSDENLYLSSTSDASNIDYELNRQSNAIYIISRDREPISYCKTKDEANSIIWELANKLRSEQIDYSYNYFLCTEYENEVTVYGMYKNWIISYDRKFGTFSYLKIFQNN